HGANRLGSVALSEILIFGRRAGEDAAKYAAGGSEHIIPARVAEDVAKRAQALAVRAHKALGCEGMSRVDMIARSTDIVVLEVNTIPGMTGTRLLPDAARAAGISFPDLLSRLVENALRRKNRRA
ncbi:MAG: D-alanine--D-alanine ligase, partial [Armatimonadetes bacterium]|nr:D-alanine--D-alanine ligase [Armatimonadota bacterium]